MILESGIALLPRRWGAPKWPPKPPNARSAPAKPWLSSISRRGLGHLPSAGDLAEALDRGQRAGHLQRALRRRARLLRDVGHRPPPQDDARDDRRRDRDPR